MLQRLALVSSCMWAIAACEPGIEPDDDIFRAGAYVVSAPDLVYHASPDGEPLGRVFRDEAIELRQLEDDGWALAHVPSAALPCVWLRFRDEPDPSVRIYNFAETPVSAPSGDECEAADPAAMVEDRTAFASQVSDDDAMGTPIRTDCDRSDYWKNWDWESGAGVGPSDGVLARDSEIYWRYVTIDGNGVMARIDDDNWVFVARPCIPLPEPPAH